MVQGDETMKVVRASSLDRHDRARFNELRSNDEADKIIETEFDNFVDNIFASKWLRRARIVAGPLPRLDVGYRAPAKKRRA
jgi:hypothetical protein